MQVEEFTVRDRLGPLIIKGEMLADCRYGSENNPRWTEMALYRITDSGDSPRPAKVIEDRVKGSLNNGQRAALAGVLPRLVRFVQEEQPTYKYVVEVVARSYVYHRIDGSCVRKRHLITTVGDVRESEGRWRNLFQCSVCKPPELEDMAPEARIAEEQSDSYVYLCTSAPDVLSKLYRRDGEISALAAKLLQKAALHDVEIEKALAKTRRI